MLSSQTITTVKATIPVLTEHGVALTRHFYTRMFRENPEVMPFFNPANQSAGRQQQALAAAIVAYAKNIENPEVLAGAVELISQKHASLMVKREHYPIVGANLIGAISEVLGEGATEDVLTAWGEAYGFLADLLASREEEIVEENAKRTGGWSGFRKFVVSGKRAESEVITSFYLSPEDGGELPSFLPGQYITLRLPTADGSTTMRNYSLSDVPGAPYFRISVKREAGLPGKRPAGHVSTTLHGRLNEGDVLDVGPPCGEFFLDVEHQSKPVVFLAGGVGVTPLFSMVQAELESDRTRDVTFIHACVDLKSQAFRNDLDVLGKAYDRLSVHHRYSETSGGAHLPKSSSGFVDIQLIDQLCEKSEATFYVCGPAGFMSAMTQTLSSAGVDAAQIRTEAFGPKE